MGRLATWKGGDAYMTTYEGLILMIAFATLIVTLIGVVVAIVIGVINAKK